MGGSKSDFFIFTVRAMLARY